MIIYNTRNNFHARIYIYIMFTVPGFLEKEANNFTPAHRKKHNKLRTHSHTHTLMHTHTHTLTHIHSQTHSKDKWEAESEATKKEIQLEIGPERVNTVCLPSQFCDSFSLTCSVSLGIIMHLCFTKYINRKFRCG